MTLLTQGKVLVTNWHVFEPQAVNTGGVSSKVIKAGVVRCDSRVDHHRRQDDHGQRDRGT